MKKKTGILYGVGVGPGDPENITIKALKIINQTKYLAFPGNKPEETLCVKIAIPVMDSPEKKEYIACPVTMTKDKAVLEADYEAIRDKIVPILERGEDVAFLNLGDPTVYATYMYVHKKVEEAGFEARIINGITSFCAAAARLDISLGMRNEIIHIIPGSYDIETVLQYPGTKVLMKSASKMDYVKKTLVEKGLTAMMVENCGLENERIFLTAKEIDEEAGYMSLIIVRDDK